MKDWVYFYIEHTIKYGEPFYKESGKISLLDLLVIAKNTLAITNYFLNNT